MTRMLRLALAGLALLALPRLSAFAQDTAPTDASGGMSGMSGMMMDHSPGTAPSAMMIIPMMKNPMLPGMAGMKPKTTPWLPGSGVDMSKLAEAKASETLTPKDGDTLEVKAEMVRRTIKEKPHIMYAFNGMNPGPTLKVKQNSTLYIRF